MTTVLDNVPLGQVQIRWSDYKAQHLDSAYYRSIAAPDDQVLYRMWVLEATQTLTTSVFIAFVFASIALYRRVRTNPFNLYLLYLMVPDFMYSFSCFFTCMLSARVGHYYSPWMCRFQSWYLVTGMTGNAWLNAFVAKDVYVLLQSSHRRVRYHPPSLRTVTRNSLGVYVLAAVIGLINIVGWDWIPADVNAHFGFVCIPIAYDRASTIFYWLFLFPLYFLIPYLYVIWVFYDVRYRSKLFPPRGKRRELAIYFFRIVAVFVFLWGPSVFAFYAFRGVAGPWFTWVVGSLGHTQGLVSAALCLMKPDVAKAAKYLLRCQLRPEEKRNSTGSGRTHRTSDRFSLLAASVMGASGRSFRWSRSSLYYPDAVVSSSLTVAPGESQVMTTRASTRRAEFSHDTIAEEEEGSHLSSNDLPMQNEDFEFVDELELPQRLNRNRSTTSEEQSVAVDTREEEAEAAP